MPEMDDTTGSLSCVSGIQGSSPHHGYVPPSRKLAAFGKVCHADVEGGGGDVQGMDGVAVQQVIEDLGQVVRAVVDKVWWSHWSALKSQDGQQLGFSCEGYGCTLV
jgi:hypothetical protein